VRSKKRVRRGGEGRRERVWSLQLLCDRRGELVSAVTKVKESSISVRAKLGSIVLWEESADDDEIWRMGREAKVANSSMGSSCILRRESDVAVTKATEVVIKY
jgi:hypothetical protein